MFDISLKYLKLWSNSFMKTEMAKELFFQIWISARIRTAFPDLIYFILYQLFRRGIVTKATSNSGASPCRKSTHFWLIHK